jgi:flavin reductase (DIM6/NTAB) family NADH-FMN oxidoreductase RutF/rubredoxin
MSKTDAFLRLTYGLYLVTCADEDRQNAYIANTVFQVTSQPARMAISCHKENFSAGLIREGGRFGISVLQKDTPVEFIRRFGYQSGRDVKKFGQLNYKKGNTGVPIVYDYTIAWFECSVKQQIDADTHWLFIGEVVDFGMLSSYEEPLDYTYYRNTYKAASPAKAPTYIPADDTPVTGDHPSVDTRFACAICEYVYNPAKGDPSGGIPPGTPFEDLPDDWLCPICGAGKAVFSETGGHY